MRYAKLGKVTSTVSLMALLAAAGMSSAQAAPTVQANVSVKSGVSLTPHIFEKAITIQPLAPEPSGLCGEAGLEPATPADTIEYHYEVRKNVVTAVANPGYFFDPALGLQTTWVVNGPYFTCPDPDMFIVHPIAEPWFDDFCGTANDVTHLPADTDKYRYSIIGNEVVATETDGHIFQQDIVHAFPIELSNKSCEVAPPVAPAVPVPVAETPQPVSAAPEAPADPVSELTPVEVPVAAAASTVITPTNVSADVAAASVPASETKLAETGPDDVLWFLFGIGLMAVAIGTGSSLGSRGYFSRR